jgi:Rod binding domain-containing protein
MQTFPLQRAVKASELPLDKVVRSSVLSEPEKVAAASRAFEAILLRQVLETAQKPVFQSKLMGNSTSDSIYRDLITNQLADSISKSGALGLSKSIEPQLTRQTKHKTGAQPVGAQPVTASSTASTAGIRNGALHFPTQAGTATANHLVKPSSEIGHLVTSPVQTRLHSRSIKHE